MARTKTINPCVQKGRYGGGRYAGRRYFDAYGNAFEVKACECAVGFIARDWPNAERHVDRKTFLPCRPSRKALAVLPCQETFRKRASAGTKHYRKAVKSKFTGCEEVERYLVEANEVIHKPREALGLHVVIEGYSREFEVDPSERVRAFERDETDLAIQEKKGKRHIHAVSRSPVFDFSGPTPKDLRHVLLIDLLDRGYFSYDERLEAAAWLIHEEMTTGDWVSVLSEKINVTDLHRYQSRVYRILEEKKTDRQRKWEQFWSSLTTKQQNALRLVYMENDEGRTREEIAKSLKISLESLNDRLDGAIKKLKQCFG